MTDQPPSSDARFTPSATPQANGSAPTSSADGASPAQAEQAHAALRGLVEQWRKRADAHVEDVNNGHAPTHEADRASGWIDCADELDAVLRSLRGAAAGRFDAPVIACEGSGHGDLRDTDRERLRAMTQESATMTPPWVLVTRAQLQQGWMELRGVTPVHHEYLVIEEIARGERHEPIYKVRSPELWMREHPVERMTRQSSPATAPDMGISAIRTRKAPSE